MASSTLSWRSAAATTRASTSRSRSRTRERDPLPASNSCSAVTCCNKSEGPRESRGLFFSFLHTRCHNYMHADARDDTSRAHVFTPLPVAKAIINALRSDNTDARDHEVLLGALFAALQ